MDDRGRKVHSKGAAIDGNYGVGHGECFNPSPSELIIGSPRSTMLHTLSTQYDHSVPTTLPLGPSLLSLVRQDLHLRLNLADVVMITAKVTNPALGTRTETALVRGDEAPIASEQATIFFGLAVWISLFTSLPIAECHLLKLQNFVSLAANTSEVASPSTRPFQAILKVPAFHFPPNPLLSRGDRRGFHNLGSHEGCSIGSSFNPSYFALVAWVKDISKDCLGMNYFMVNLVVVLIHVLRSATLRKRSITCV